MIPGTSGALNGFRALLAAGGFGTRLRPITEHTPKCLVPINGKPLLGYWLDLLCCAGVEKILINTHYLPDLVRDYCLNHPNSDRLLLVHEEKLLGTAGTLLANSAFFGNKSFLFAHADNLSLFSIEAFVAQFNMKAAHEIGTMMTFVTDCPKDCGIVTVDARAALIAYTEKPLAPVSNLANAAVFLFDERIHQHLNSMDSAPCDFCAEVVPTLVGRLNTFHNSSYHRDIGTVEALNQANRDMSNSNSRYVH